jgi:hypothetical protein
MEAAINFTLLIAEEVATGHSSASALEFATLFTLEQTMWLKSHFK